MPASMAHTPRLPGRADPASFRADLADVLRPVLGQFRCARNSADPYVPALLTGVPIRPGQVRISGAVRSFRTGSNTPSARASPSRFRSAGPATQEGPRAPTREHRRPRPPPAHAAQVTARYPTHLRAADPMSEHVYAEARPQGRYASLRDGPRPPLPPDTDEQGGWLSGRRLSHAPSKGVHCCGESGHVRQMSRVISDVLAIGRGVFVGFASSSGRVRLALAARVPRWCILPARRKLILPRLSVRSWRSR